ncbi:unnamed protein product [Bursaphelenchus okinawaensis]|uniref:F-box domain-containing protein n=1 Tax=Bursaphelenchus okinawaensis TaxID=465554 RepID=A0A811KCZ8_9BILA|nr:unnamed protein product [Bursaphelenchus okinawaensis]CAG9100725.1 unnamed protein product [Bursaphelenchus okinawaensis]
MSKEIKERWKLNNYIWQEVVNVIPDIDTIAALATVNKYFYKIVGIDFKTRCIQNGIYRLPRELWSEAFSHVCRRFDNHYYNLFASPRLSQNTSRISAILNNEVIVTTIDFNRHFIQTFKIRGYAYHLKLYNKGTRFILRPAFDGFLRVYDVESRKLLWEHPIDYLEKKRRICIMSDFCIYDKRTKEVYDPYALKAHKIDIKDVVGFKCAYNDYHDYYFSFHVKPFDAEREVVVMNVRTKKLSCFPVQHVFCDEISRGNCDDKVMPATECVLIFDNVTNDVKIYDIPSETLKHNFHFETTYTNTLFLNETMFVSTQ